LGRGDRLGCRDQVETIALENGGELTIKWVDLHGLSPEDKALVDGHIAFGPLAPVKLNLSEDSRLGDIFGVVTVATPRYLGKGNGQVIPWLDYDLVIYGGKKLVTTEKFYFNCTGKPHVGEVKTDPQAFVNFGFHNHGLALAAARKFMLEVRDAAKDEVRLRRLFLKHSKRNDQDDSLDVEGWILRKALVYGVSINRFPGLFRRVVRYLMKRVMECEEGRIPMGDIALYGYVIPDPYAIQRDGMPNSELCRIGENEICVPDLKSGTEVEVYRQPSENSNAHYHLTNVVNDGYRRFKHRGICILGKGAMSVLGRLGGGDMDDSFVIVHDPNWVANFQGLQYPETEKLSHTAKPVEALYADDPFFAEMCGEEISAGGPMRYTTRHFSYQIEMARQASAGIGPVVNACLIDLLLSEPENKLSLIEDLMATKSPAGEARAEWLLTRPDYQMALFATNLELIIDGNVKDTSLLVALGNVSKQLKDFHLTTQVYPVSMRNRIPESKQKKADYVFAKSLYCKTLETIAMLRDQLMESFKEHEWFIAAPADAEVLELYPADKEIKTVVKDLRTIWREMWEIAFSQGLVDSDRENTYRKIELLIEGELAQYPPQIHREIAVELYRQTYRMKHPAAKLDETTGHRRNFPDGLLWTNMIGNTLIDVFREAQVAGLYLPIELDRYYKGIYDQAVEVKVVDTCVFRHLDNALLGFSAKCPNGNYLMDGGLICVRAAQQAVQHVED
jgi:hypothetical protein